MTKKLKYMNVSIMEDRSDKELSRQIDTACLAP